MSKEDAVEKLSKSLCLELTGFVNGSEDGQRKFIEDLIKEWLVTNKFVQLDEEKNKPNGEGWWQMFNEDEYFGCFQVTRCKDGFVVNDWGNEPELVSEMDSDIKWLKPPNPVKHAQRRI
jgi:hypothetical protein